VSSALARPSLRGEKRTGGDTVIIYKVFCKDYVKRTCKLMGVLHERRRDLRGLNPSESGLRMARVVFGNLMKDNHTIIVVPKELRQGREYRLSARQDI
jgi:hypothetical protein